MSVVRKAAGVLLATAAMCGAGATAASAAPADDGAPPGAVKIRVLERELGVWDWVKLGGFTCPPDHPWLVNHNYSPGRIVPYGVQVNEPGGIGVSIGLFTQDDAGYVTGWPEKSSTATNWWAPATLSIDAYCTMDRDLGHTGRNGT